MTGFWLVSYLALWGIVVLLALLLVGALRQLGALHLRLAGQAPEETAGREAAVAPLEQDGPELGSPLPDWAQEVATWHDEPDGVMDAHRDGAPQSYTLLMFLSPLCEACQHVVEPLNELARDGTRHVRPAAIIRADPPAYEAFLNVFPLRLPTLRDSDRTLTMELGVHRAPFGLLYSEGGMLARKGLIENREDLLALLADEPATDADANIVRSSARAPLAAVR